MTKPLLIVRIGETLLKPEELEAISKSFLELKENFQVVVYNQPQVNTKLTVIATEEIKITEL